MKEKNILESVAVVFIEDNLTKDDLTKVGNLQYEYRDRNGKVNYERQRTSNFQIRKFK